MAKKKTKLFNYDVDVVEAGKFAGIGFIVFVLIQKGKDLPAKFNQAIKWLQDNIAPIAILAFLGLFGRFLLPFVPAWGIIGLAAVVGVAWHNGYFSSGELSGGKGEGGGDCINAYLTFSSEMNGPGISTDTGEFLLLSQLKKIDSKTYRHETSKRTFCIVEEK